MIELWIVSVPFRGYYLLNGLADILKSVLTSFRPLSRLLSSQSSPSHPAIHNYSIHPLRGKTIFCPFPTCTNPKNILNPFIFKPRGKMHTGPDICSDYTPYFSTLQLLFQDFLFSCFYSIAVQAVCHKIVIHTP